MLKSYEYFQISPSMFLDDVDDIGLIVSSVWSQGQYHKIATHCFLRIVCGQKISAQVDEYEGQAIAKCVLQVKWQL